MGRAARRREWRKESRELERHVGRRELDKRRRKTMRRALWKRMNEDG